jgi:hypothetical protein
MFPKWYRIRYTKHTGLKYLCALARQSRRQGECYIRKAHRKPRSAMLGNRHVIFSWRPGNFWPHMQYAYWHYLDTCQPVASKDLWRITNR